MFSPILLSYARAIVGSGCMELHGSHGRNNFDKYIHRDSDG